jgi:non-homologous end joining protein Ku
VTRASTRKGEENRRAEAAQLALAKQLIDAYTVPFNINKFKDPYEGALRKLVEAKVNNLPVPQLEIDKKPAVHDTAKAKSRGVVQLAVSIREDPLLL